MNGEESKTDDPIQDFINRVKAIYSKPVQLEALRNAIRDFPEELPRTRYSSERILSKIYRSPDHSTEDLETALKEAEEAEGGEGSGGEGGRSVDGPSDGSGRDTTIQSQLETLLKRIQNADEFKPTETSVPEEYKANVNNKVEAIKRTIEKYEAAIKAMRTSAAAQADAARDAAARAADENAAAINALQGQLSDAKSKVASLEDAKVSTKEEAESKVLEIQTTLGEVAKSMETEKRKLQQAVEAYDACTSGLDKISEFVDANQKALGIQPPPGIGGGIVTSPRSRPTHPMAGIARLFNFR